MHTNKDIFKIIMMPLFANLLSWWFYFPFLMSFMQTTYGVQVVRITSVPPKSGPGRCLRCAWPSVLSGPVTGEGIHGHQLQDAMKNNNR